MASITNSSNVDIIDRPVNTSIYTIAAGETITDVPEIDANELLAVYGFLTKGPDVQTAEPEKVEEKVEEVATEEPEVGEVSPDVPVEEPVDTEVSARTRRRRNNGS